MAISPSSKASIYFLAALIFLANYIAPFAFAVESADTKKIGMLLALTGDFAMFGEEAKKGALIAAEEINALRKDAVQLIFEDDKCLPKDAVTGFNKLRNVDQVDILVGPGCTGGILAVSPLAKSAKLPMLALFDTNDEVQKTSDHTFAIGFASEEEGRLGALAMRKKGLTKVGVAYETDAWAEVVKKSFIKNFEAQGGKVVVDEAQNVSDKDWRPILNRIRAKGADSMYLVPAYNGGPVLKQIAQLQLKLPIFGPDTFGIPEVIETAGEAAEGIIFTNVSLDEGTENVKRFVASYTTKFGQPPRTLFYGALGYDGVQMAYKALQNSVGTLEGLKQVNFPGTVLGIVGIKANRMGDVPIGYWTVRGGKFEKIAQ